VSSGRGGRTRPHSFEGKKVCTIQQAKVRGGQDDDRLSEDLCDRGGEKLLKRNGNRYRIRKGKGGGGQIVKGVRPNRKL